MPLKIVWGITGSGDLLSDTFEVMSELAKMTEIEITTVLSKAAVKVVKWYRLWDKLNSIPNKLFIEEDDNTQFIIGGIQKGNFNCLLVAPATANTVAKIVNGIADTIITNAVSQANKANVDIYILPVDKILGTITTILPGGKKLELTMRDVDIENTNKLRKMKGIHILEKPSDIKTVINRFN